MSLGESHAKNHAYNPIQDSWQDDWQARKVLPRVSPRVWKRVWARLFARLFALANRLAESLGLDYMYWQDSLRNSFFTRDTTRVIAINFDLLLKDTNFIYFRRRRQWRRTTTKSP